MKLIQEYPQFKTIRTMAQRRGVPVYLVGGFIRNYLLDNKNQDFDFAMAKGALSFAKSFAKKIKGAYVLLDQDRGCARVVKKQKGSILSFDFADYRAPSFRRDLNLRDFTINTLSVHINKLKDDDELESVILDHKNASKELKSKTVKLVQKNAFKDDPLRMLRAYSISSVHKFKIHAETLAQIKKDKELIADVSYERIRDELFKILSTDQAAKTLKQMDKIGLLVNFLPQINVMFNCQQGGYHHLDVWPHSLETVHQLEKLFKEFEGDKEIADYIHAPIAADRSRGSIIKLAALLHDIGKPQTRVKEKNRLSFHGHEHVGRKITRVIAQKLMLSTRERYALEDMVLFHLRPGYLSNDRAPSERMIFRYLRDTKEEGASVLLLSLADQRSTCGPLTTKKDQLHHEKICKSLIYRFFEKRKEKPLNRLINGYDLIKRLKLKPQPQFSRILAAVEEKQSLGKITTKTEALALAKKLVTKK